LIIEDEIEIAELIRMYLSKDGMKSVICEYGEKGLQEFKSDKFDLIVLDINLPGIDGFEFLAELRKISDVPVIIVSSRKADEDLVLGLGIGADEFVVKPFSPKVLVARIRAHLRRYSDYLNKSGDIVAFGPYTFDLDGHILLMKQEERKVRIPLAPKEAEMLCVLIKKKGKAYTVEEIYRAVWGDNTYGDRTTIAIHIQRIRKKIEKDPVNPVYILNVYGQGYKFNEAEILA
jgi:two-component system response regulator RegX3